MFQGTFENGPTVYKGIPFAAQPTGDLRWKAPQSPAKWNGVLMADKFAPGAVQRIDPPSAKVKIAYTSTFGLLLNQQVKKYPFLFGFMAEALHLDTHRIPYIMTVFNLL